MKSILENLNRSVGVIGSAVMTPDGMLVASAIADREHQDTLAAVGSSLVLSAKKSLKNFGSEPKMMTIDGSRGKIVLVNAGSAFLLVITESTISLDSTLLDIKSAVAKLQKTISLA
jgi:predicted regulator of Ras-like GTPase activity (Roadblock/LC7/MglB family)